MPPCKPRSGLRALHENCPPGKKELSGTWETHPESPWRHQTGVQRLPGAVAVTGPSRGFCPGFPSRLLPPPCASHPGALSKVQSAQSSPGRLAAIGVMRVPFRESGLRGDLGCGSGSDSRVQTLAPLRPAGEPPNPSGHPHTHLLHGEHTCVNPSVVLRMN